jgi:hypothetical protein
MEVVSYFSIDWIWKCEGFLRLSNQKFLLELPSSNLDQYILKVAPVLTENGKRYLTFAKDFDIDRCSSELAAILKNCNP